MMSNPVLVSSDPSRITTSELLRVFPRSEKFENMNRREKGFYYEMYIHRLLQANNVDFSGNPSVYSEWEENQGRDYDLRTNLPNDKTIKVECKLALKPIYHSWFERDWSSRDADIFVTNDVFAISYDDRKMLEESGKKLLSTTEFVMYIQKIIRGNKYGYLNSIINIISRVEPNDKHCKSILEDTRSVHKDILDTFPASISYGKNNDSLIVSRRIFTVNNSVPRGEKEGDRKILLPTLSMC